MMTTSLRYTWQELKLLKQNKEQVILSPFTLEALMKFCHKRTILSLFIEGGQKTLTHFIENHLWDEARVFISEKKFTLAFCVRMFVY